LIPLTELALICKIDFYTRAAFDGQIAPERVELGSFRKI